MGSSPSVRLTPAEVVAGILGAAGADSRRRLLQAALGSPADAAVLAELRAEAARQLWIDTHAALRLAEALIEGAALAGSAGHRALGLLVKADALRYLGRYQESVALYEAARAAFLEQEDAVGWARTFSGWVISCHYLGRGAAALAALGPAQETLTRRAEWLRAAALHLNAGLVCWRLGRYGEALARYDQAQGLYEGLGAVEAASVGMCLGNKALISTLMGEFDSALELHEQARARFVRQGEHLSVLRTDQYIAEVYAGQGDYTRALRLYGEVLAALEQAEMEVDAAWAALGIVECFLSLNRDEEALRLAEEALARFERCGSPTEAAQARVAAALAQARLGHTDAALALLEAAAATFAATGQTGQHGLVALHRAELHLAAEAWAAAAEEAARAEQLFAAGGQAVRAAQAALLRARADLGAGRPAAATTRARAALATVEERGARWLAPEGHRLLAEAARARGDLGAALATYRAALDSLDAVQCRLTPELRSAFLTDKQPLYDGAVDCALAAGEVALAFDCLERGKSRALIDYLAGNPAIRMRAPAADPALEAELARLRAEHHWFYRRLYGDGLARRVEGEVEADRRREEEALAAAVRERERRIGRLLERLALQRPTALEAGAAGAGAEGPPRLDGETALLEFSLREEGGHIFVLTAEGLTVVPLAARAGTIRRLLALWALTLEAATRAAATGAAPALPAPSARGVLEGLYQALIAPAAAQLAGRRRLVVIPTGPLHAVPFHALHSGARYLVEDWEIAVSPSSTLWRLCAERPRRRGGSALVLAHSDGGRLAGALAEGAAVAALLPGSYHAEAAATRAALAAGAPHHAVVHLAAHGEARLDNPAFAHVTLADGQLSTVDIFNLELSGALVTLSACETGRGVVAGGDESISLSRGFLYAGASTLVQSLWRVEDGSTARLMEGFYAALAAGQPAGAALRAAQLAQLAERGEHPYLWAPFQLVGDGNLRIDGVER